MKTSIMTTLALAAMCTGLVATAQSISVDGYVETSPGVWDYVGNETPSSSATTIVVMPPYTTTEKPIITEAHPINVGPDFAGQQVDMIFRVDTNGRPYNIDADTSNMPDRYTNVKTASLVTQLAVEIGFWRFEPARDSAGNPIERTVRLPMTLGTSSSPSQYGN
jgi:hypothetical protein